MADQEEALGSESESEALQSQGLNLAADQEEASGSDSETPRPLLGSMMGSPVPHSQNLKTPRHTQLLQLVADSSMPRRLQLVASPLQMPLTPRLLDPLTPRLCPSRPST